VVDVVGMNPIREVSDGCELRYSKVEGYFRYVDDIILVYQNNLTNIEILNLFNNVTPGLLFTLERE